MDVVVTSWLFLIPILLLLPHAVNTTCYAGIPPLSAARRLMIVTVFTTLFGLFARHGDVLYTKLPFALWAKVFGDCSVAHVYVFETVVYGK